MNIGEMSTDLSIARRQLSECIAIQKEVGWSDQLVSAPVILVNALDFGSNVDLGFVLVATDETQKVNGFARVGCTTRMDTYWLHELAVSPSKQHQGIGFALMSRIRDVCISREASTLMFTYDPLSSHLSHLYLNRCGAVAVHFWRSLFAEGGEQIQHRTPEPRLLSRWNLRNSKTHPATKLSDYRKVPIIDAPSDLCKADRGRVMIPGTSDKMILEEAKREGERFAAILDFALNEEGLRVVGVIDNSNVSPNYFLCVEREQASLDPS
jgi:predicted GNAT superfamily acetyltransferase